MNIQTALFEDEAPAKPTDRLFLALIPVASAARQMADIASERRRMLGLSGAPLAVERLHVTLHHIGDFLELPPSLVGAVTKAAEMMAAAPFDITFDQVQSFHNQDNNNPFVLCASEGNAELNDFQARLGGALIRAGAGQKIKRAFAAHATLLYDRKRVAPQPVEPVSWTASEFVLVHSLLGKTRHTVIGRWPLRG